MSAPLSSSEQNQILSVDSALSQHIRQSQSGDINYNKISELQNQLAKLSDNPNIPESVRENLQAALSDLKKVQEGNTANLACLNSAKAQLDHVIEDIEGQDVGGGSLGGGSEE